MIRATNVAEALHHLNNLSVEMPGDDEMELAGSFSVTRDFKEDGTARFSFSVKFEGVSVMIWLEDISESDLGTLLEAYNHNVQTLLPFVYQRNEEIERRSDWEADFRERMSEIYQDVYLKAFNQATEELKGTYWGSFEERRSVRRQALINEMLEANTEYMAKEDHPVWRSMFEAALEASLKASPGINAPGIDGDIRKYTKMIEQTFPRKNHHAK